MAGLLLFVDSFINHCYLLVSGSVRVRRGVVDRFGLGLGLVLVLRLGLGLALGLQLGIGIGFRRNHSSSSRAVCAATARLLFGDAEHLDGSHAANVQYGWRQIVSWLTSTICEYSFSGLCPV